MPLTAAEQKELDQLEYDKLLAEKEAIPESQAASVGAAKEESGGAPTYAGMMLGRRANALKAQGWENLSTTQRLELVATSLPKFLTEEVLGKAEGLVERSAGPALGQMAGRMTGIPMADRVLGGLGGAAGEALAEVREGGDIRPGAIASAAISGAVRGKPLAGAAPGQVAKEGAKYAGVGLAGKTTETAVDEGRLPTAREAVAAAGSSAIGAPIAKAVSKTGSFVGGREPLYDMEMETLRDLRKEGVVIPPHEIGAGSETLSSFGGKAALQQEAAKRNQFVWQKLAREEIGLSKEALPIRQSELEAKRTALGAPYREIQTIHREANEQLRERLAVIAKEPDPHHAMIMMEEPAMKESLSILSTLAQADVNALKEARFAAQRSRKAFYNGDPNAYEPWQAAKTQAEQLENAIERAAASLRDDSLLSRLKESRKRIAQTYNVEEALNPGNGFVDPLAFGRQLASDVPLTGNLEKIAKFQLAFRREAVEAGRVPAPGVGNIGAMATTSMASRGDVPGVMGAIANMTVGRAARPILLSDMMQNSMLSPQERQNFAAVLARYLAEESAQAVTKSEPAPANR